MKNTEEVIKSNKNLARIFFVFLLALLLTIPILKTVRSHPDEHQFYFNAFKIMAGEELHNYLHVATTEYALSAFFLVVNLFSDSGVNFPQGDPSLATFYYGKVFGLILYMLGFLLGVLILQRNEKGVKLRSVFFSIFYFASLGMFERFIRVNSDSMSILIFLNFIILSFFLHRKKETILKFFLLNLSFIFLATFTNLKALFLMLPLFLINLFLPFISYEKKKDTDFRLSNIYRFLSYIGGLLGGSVLLWVLLSPRPFSHRKFWYGLKKTILHGTKFDFDYPSQSFNSAWVYLYDLIVHQIGLFTILAVIIVFVIVYRTVGKELVSRLWLKAKGQINLASLLEGNLYGMTELILALSFLSYYVGVSMRIVHWSRWGAPLGFIALMLLSTFLANVVKIATPYKDKIKPRLMMLIPSLFILTWMLRIFLTIDLFASNYPEDNGFKQTWRDNEKLLIENNISLEDGSKKALWFTGPAHLINSSSLENLVEKEYSEVEYILWPYWNIGVLHTKKSVDNETRNQREFIDKYAESVTYRFPNLLSYYMHYTKFFAWRVLGITWNPELDSLVETQYGVVKLKEPIDTIKLDYTVPFKNMSHYHFPYSLIFNLKTIQDGYLFPPCYTYPDVRNIRSGDWVRPPEEIGIGARTAGLYCHSARFRVMFAGTYRIRVLNLPEDPDGSQMVYSNITAFDWDPETKTITVDIQDTMITTEFGVATKEKKIKDLEFLIFYNH